MEILENIITIIQVFVSIIVIILVLLQDHQSKGNIITGTANQSGSMGASKDAKLARLTKIFGLVWIILTIASGSLILIVR